MKTKAKWMSGPVAILAALCVLFISCGDDDDDDNDDDASGCEPLSECAVPPMLADELPEMEFEVSGTEDCETVGLGIEVLEARASENRSRMEARINFTAMSDGPFYTYTINSAAGTQYADREACYLEISESGAYNVVHEYDICLTGMEIHINADRAYYECSDVEWNPVCRFGIAFLPWPPEGDCVENPKIGDK
ncbi:MAG: hypothetical protein M5R36_17680 [Deltaproteobacteria bacterium]|nr:hypothetical protein [Deltaproteobacteria bacterium]